jgi:hypothetical protein
MGLFLIDVLNLPSKYIINKFDQIHIMIFVFLVLFLILLVILDSDFFDSIKIKSINWIDKLTSIIFLTVSFYSIIIFIAEMFNNNKKPFLTLFILSATIFIAIRYYRYNNQIENLAKMEKNIYDLKEIIEDDIELGDDGIILLEESEVNYDLLKRSDLIHQVKNALLKSYTDGKFVISLEGEWGSGKTTIINNAIKEIEETNEDIIIINDFDPWNYNSQESLFLNMLDTIMEKSGFNHSMVNTKKLIEGFTQTIFGREKSNFIFKTVFKDFNDVKIIKDKINDYLRFSNRRIIFIVDNIDRLEKEEIFLLFKIITNTLDFEYVTYLISFDSEKIKKIYDSKVGADYSYLKKVIQMQIQMPKIDKNNYRFLITKSLHKILKAYGENKNDLQNYDVIIDQLCYENSDLRDFKRFINSTITAVFDLNSNLLNVDLIALKYISLTNYPLYQEIYDNSNFFISHHRINEAMLYAESFNKDKYEKKKKKYFENLFSNDKHKKYQYLLSSIFPNARNYKSDINSVFKNASDKNYKLEKNIDKNKRIFSAKYFNLYFTQTNNAHLEINKEVEGLVNTINQSEDQQKSEELLKSILKKIGSDNHKEFFEVFQEYIEYGDVKRKSCFILTKALFKSLDIIDASMHHLGLNAQSRTELIIWKLLQKISDKEYDEFLDLIRYEYGKIYNIKRIIYWFNNDNEDINIKGRKEKINAKWKDIRNEIIDEEISIYDDQYYTFLNIFGLFSLSESVQDEEVEKIKDYIRKVINKDNIFRLLNDLINRSFGSGVRYSIKKRVLEKFTTEEEIDEILKLVEPQNSDQEFILKIYNDYKGIEKENDDLINGIVINELKNLKPYE